jgi:hypothetical protein
MSCPKAGINREDSSTITPTGIYVTENSGRSVFSFDQEDSPFMSVQSAGYKNQHNSSVTGMTAGATTLITLNEAHDLVVGDTCTVWAIDPANPFYPMNFKALDVLTIPTTSTLTVRWDSSTYAAWKALDVATLGGGAFKLKGSITSDHNVRFESPGGRFSFRQYNDDSYLQYVEGIPVLLPKYLTDVASATCLAGPSCEPDVTGVGTLHLDSTIPLTITNFLINSNATRYGEKVGRILVVRHDNTNTGMTNSAELQLMGQADVVGQTGMVQIFEIMDDAKGSPYHYYWMEISRSYLDSNIHNVWNNKPATPQVGQMFICSNCTDCGAGKDYPVWWNGTA